jgi:hypothetical protein
MSASVVGASSIGARRGVEIAYDLGQSLWAFRSAAQRRLEALVASQGGEHVAPSTSHSLRKRVAGEPAQFDAEHPRDPARSTRPSLDREPAPTSSRYRDAFGHRLGLSTSSRTPDRLFKLALRRRQQARVGSIAVQRAREQVKATRGDRLAETFALGSHSTRRVWVERRLGSISKPVDDLADSLKLGDVTGSLGSLLGAVGLLLSASGSLIRPPREPEREERDQRRHDRQE